MVWLDKLISINHTGFFFLGGLFKIRWVAVRFYRIESIRDKHGAKSKHENYQRDRGKMEDGKILKNFGCGNNIKNNSQTKGSGLASFIFQVSFPFSAA
jgi:hypothetical protein